VSGDIGVPPDDFDSPPGVPVLNLNAVCKELTAAPIGVLELSTTSGDTYRWPVYRRNFGLRFMAAAKDEDIVGMTRAILGDDRIGVSIDLGPEAVETLWEFVNHEMGFDKPGESSASPGSSSITTTPSRPIFNTTSV
jgi:hypothetical protein